MSKQLLEDAVKSNNFLKTKLFIEQINYTDSKNLNLLHIAVMNDNTAIAELIINKSHKYLSEKSLLKNTPLDLAILLDRTEMIELFIKFILKNNPSADKSTYISEVSNVSKEMKSLLKRWDYCQKKQSDKKQVTIKIVREELNEVAQK